MPIADLPIIEGIVFAVLVNLYRFFRHLRFDDLIRVTRLIIGLRPHLVRVRRILVARANHLDIESDRAVAAGLQLLLQVARLQHLGDNR